MPSAHGYLTHLDEDCLQLNTFDPHVGGRAPSPSPCLWTSDNSGQTASSEKSTTGRSRLRGRRYTRPVVVGDRDGLGHHGHHFVARGTCDASVSDGAHSNVVSTRRNVGRESRRPAHVPVEDVRRTAL